MEDTQESYVKVTPSLWELLWGFFIIGLTAYSVAMLQHLKTLVVGRKCLTRAEMDEGLVMVVGIIVHITLDFANHYINGEKTAFISAMSFILLLYKINAFWVILFAVALGLLFFWRDNMSVQGEKQPQHISIPGKWKWHDHSAALSARGCDVTPLAEYARVYRRHSFWADYTWSVFDYSNIYRVRSSRTSWESACNSRFFLAGILILH